MTERVSIIGKRIGAYEVRALVGAGAMGEVYRARDSTLDRDVAIKILPRALTTDPERLSRFEREARLLAALNHPNIATIHGLERLELDALGGSLHAIVMELVAGGTLAAAIAGSTHGLKVDEAIDIARQMAGALAAAHAKGIVHRDLKPSNVAITPDRRVKLLDFGLAKMHKAGGQLASEASTATIDGTHLGVILGTAAYMSPEQAQGRPVDERSDVFSFGTVLYEMLAGRSPFSATTTVETLAKVLETRPAALGSLRPGLPATLVSLVEQCLEKDRERRPSARELESGLAAIAQSASAAATGRPVERWKVALVGALTIAAAATGLGAWWMAGRDARAARGRVPELLQLADRFDYDGFYRAARDVVPRLPDDLQIKQVWLNLTFPVGRIESDPAGADVWVKGYAAVNADWISIGRTPIEEVRLPFGSVRLRVSKEGYAPVEGMPSSPPLRYPLDPAASVPQGMVRVRAASANVLGTTVPVPDFWLDRFEVTNGQFKAFVDAGGYQTQKYWTEPVIENGRTLSWNDAMTRFRDRTGRPGPSTWVLGTHPEDQADFPVSGVNWYEAAAYAAFAGKSLPTAFQWRAAASGIGGFGGIFSDILTLSNFGMQGPAAVGSHAGLGPNGTYDMAGNVKEWCWNQSAGGRMILGGAWNEPSYRYLDVEAHPALARLPTYGFRLSKSIDPPPPASYAEIQPHVRDYLKETPVDDEAFALVRGLYRYDSVPLNTRVERTEGTPAWRRETVTFDAPYGNERIIAHVFLPTATSPPYQTVVYLPGGDAPNLPSSRELRLTAVDFLMRSGRAVVFPVYKGTYERRVSVTGINAIRDVAIATGKDFGRVLEFIESRPDLDRERIGFYGDSRGTFFGVILTALEPRVKASVLLGGGLPPIILPPEIDLLNFAPRVGVPTLMVSGRGDFLAPVQTAQIPLFRLLGTASEHKRHVLFDGGHFPDQLHDIMREILNWFDRDLGAVSRVSRD